MARTDSKGTFLIQPTLHVGKVGEMGVEPYTFKEKSERLAALLDLKALYQQLPQYKLHRSPMAVSNENHPWPTIQEVLTAFLKEEVHFVIIGGYAVAFYGHVRLTKDIDLFIERTPENAQKIIAAFKRINFQHPELTVEGLMKPESVYKFGIPPNQIEILNEVKGISWEEARKGAIQESLFEQKVYFVEFEALIKTKKAAGRHQDLADVEALERIRRDSWLRGC